MKCCGVGGRLASASANLRCTSFDSSGTLCGASPRLTITAAPAWSRSTRPLSFETDARPAVVLPGSGSSTIRSGLAAGCGVCAFLGTQPAAASARTRTGRTGRYMRGLVGGDFQGERGAAHADDGGRRFEAHGIGRQLGDLPRDVGRGATNEL